MIPLLVRLETERHLNGHYLQCCEDARPFCNGPSKRYLRIPTTLCVLGRFHPRPRLEHSASALPRSARFVSKNTELSKRRMANGHEELGAISGPVVEVCSERLELLRAWTQASKTVAGVATELDEVAEHSRDFARHKEPIEETSQLHEKAATAKKLSNEHCAQHGCCPSAKRFERNPDRRYRPRGDTQHLAWPHGTGRLLTLERHTAIRPRFQGLVPRHRYP